uniref:WAT1-related protein n=1 Tax=Oryza barthii TaxID=65489 RepID=A0A0D3HC06_9ORYZ
MDIDGAGTKAAAAGWKAPASMVLVQLFITGMIMLSKVSIGGGMFIFTLLAYRSLFGAVFILPFALIFERGKWRDMDWCAFGWIFFNAFIGGCHSVTLFIFPVNLSVSPLRSPSSSAAPDDAADPDATDTAAAVLADHDLCLIAELRIERADSRPPPHATPLQRERSGPGAHAEQRSGELHAGRKEEAEEEEDENEEGNNYVPPPFAASPLRAAASSPSLHMWRTPIIGTAMKNCPGKI